MNPIRIRIFYPADPVGVVPGGVDTFLRGLIKCAPADLQFSLVGMTTDRRARPVGRWSTCEHGGREFDHFPVCAVDDAGGRGRIPLSVRFMAGVNRDRLALGTDFDIFDFHRVEPALMWSRDKRPKNVFFHQDPTFVRLAASDNLWRRLPALYERIERSAMAGMGSVWCVRESGVNVLRERYPALAEHTEFISTWVDADVFHPGTPDGKAALRAELAAAHRLDTTEPWVVSVGRLDTQKDPLLMVDAVARLRARGRRLQWLHIGDGVLRGELQQRAAAAGMADAVHLLGLQPPARIAQVLRAADAYSLSSAYEGMPMALLEALGSGLPAAVTDVGEVRRVVRDGTNGRIAAQRDAESFAVALDDVIANAASWSGAAARAVEDFHPARVLAPVYENYRRLGAPMARLRQPGASVASAAATAIEPAVPRMRHPVVGVPVDAISRAALDARLLEWAQRRQSRTVCFVNVHSVMEATADERHRMVLAGADVAAPDGAPIAWTLRAKGVRHQARVDGPGSMWRLCEQAAATGVPVGLYGASPATLEALRRNLREAFPSLQLAYAHSPPYRELTPAEDETVCRDIARAGVGLLFVSLGCPKQEYWMATHRGRIPAVMLGVGAAFEFHAGVASRAPAWMGDAGLEWLHRLATHPGRLWRRYAVTNSRFLLKSAQEALRSVGNRFRPQIPNWNSTRT